jgi:hypothetical protein
MLAKLGETVTVENSHPIWHAIYAGLGFIPNSEVPKFSDSVAMDKARSIDPHVLYTSPEYERILKLEVWNIAKRKPMVLIENLAAKVGIVALCASILLFPSRHLLFSESEIRWFDTAFVLTIGVSAMNAILVVPKVPYLLTFLCLTFMYSSLKLCRARVLSI